MSITSEAACGITPVRRGFGIAGMVLGAIALTAVVLQLVAGPLEARKPIERSVAEIAVNVRKEVGRVLQNKPAVAHPSEVTASDSIRIAAGASGALALVLAAIGFVRREDHRAAGAAAALGATSIALQFVVWLALLAAGLLLIWIVVANLDSILGT